MAQQLIYINITFPLDLDSTLDILIKGPAYEALSLFPREQVSFTRLLAGRFKSARTKATGFVKLCKIGQAFTTFD